MEPSSASLDWAVVAQLSGSDYPHPEPPPCQLLSPHLGPIPYRPDQIIEFPYGLPAFEEQRSFLLVSLQQVPLVIFLQSVTSPELLFVTLPVTVIDPHYRLELTPEACQLLRLPAEEPVQIGRHVLCLAIVTLAHEQPPTANLLAPIVVNPAARMGIQFIQCDSGYSHQHPLYRGLEGG